MIKFNTETTRQQPGFSSLLYFGLQQIGRSLLEGMI